MWVLWVVVNLVNEKQRNHEMLVYFGKFSVFCEPGNWTNFWLMLNSDFGKTLFYKIVRFCVYITPVKFHNFLWQNEFSTKLSLNSVLGQISIRFWKNYLTHFTKHFSVIFKSKMKFGMSSFTQNFRKTILSFIFFCIKI